MALLLLLLVSALSRVLGEDASAEFITHVVRGNAKCLDGTPYAYYVREGSGDGINNYGFYFQGGAWCVNARQCDSYSGGVSGSSKTWTRNPKPPFQLVQYQNGPMSANASISSFYNWNWIFFNYCDGGCFTGTTSRGGLQYQGRNNIDLTLADILKTTNIQTGEKLMIAGGSSGAQAVFLVADHIGEWVKENTQITHYKALSVSGYFLPIPSLSGAKVFPDQMNSMYRLHGSQDSIDQSCVKAQTPSEHCIFPAYSIMYTKTPIYLISSEYDYVQFARIFAPDIKWGGNCKVDGTGCTQNEMQQANVFVATFRRFLKIFTSLKNGLFLHSCWGHGIVLWPDQKTGQDYYYNGILIKGVSPRAAFENWYFDRNQQPLMDCVRDPSTPNKICNPTCLPYNNAAAIAGLQDIDPAMSNLTTDTGTTFGSSAKYQSFTQQVTTTLNQLSSIRRSDFQRTGSKFVRKN